MILHCQRCNSVLIRGDPRRRDDITLQLVGELTAALFIVASHVLVPWPSAVCRSDAAGPSWNVLRVGVKAEGGWAFAILSELDAAALMVAILLISTWEVRVVGVVYRSINGASSI